MNIALPQNEQTPLETPFEITTLIPPSASDVEASIISSILIDNATFSEVSGIIQPGDFYKTAHRHIFAAICDLRRNGDPVDLLILNRFQVETNYPWPGRQAT